MVWRFLLRESNNKIQTQTHTRPIFNPESDPFYKRMITALNNGDK